MANRNNSGRTKKSHNYRPYDTSSSFVKRITSKVSEILPQPTSWVSRWFSPASKLNTRGHDELDEEDDEEEERLPPSKRHCFGPSETSDFTHQNNVNRLSDLGRGSGEISPILSSRGDEDRAIPGPSGLHLRHFVSSTPAVRQASPIPSQVNLREKARDDASDESETTSGCSSLVPGTERPHTRQEQLSTPTAPSPVIPNPGSLRRLSTSTFKPTSLLNRTSSMNLTTSSQPSFDTYVFNNPLNRSSLRRSIVDDSCFYPGQTTFGGSSSRLSAAAEPPRVVSVKVSPTNQAQRDIIGTSAQRILKALEQFSTPVLDAKRIPMRKETGRNERKRKVPQPYEELIYPSMPDLLRVKRREEEARRQRVRPSDEGSGSSQRPSASTSKSKPQASTPPVSAPPVSDVSTPSHSQYTLRPENSKDRHVGSIKGRNKDEDFELERVPEVNLPNVKLQLSSLPKFDISVPPPQPKATTQSKSPSTAKSPPFKFSEPEVPKVQLSKENKTCLPVNTFKFSEPLEPLECNKKRSQPAAVNKVNEKLPTPVLQMKNPSPVSKLKRKTPEASSQFPSNFKFEVKPPTEMKNASVMEVLSKKPFGNDSTVTGHWTCSVCHAKNSVGQSKCVPCGKPKPSPSKETPTLMWDCKKCSLKNSSSETKCKSCGLNKTESPSSTTFKFEGFSKPKDTWECSACLVNNKNSMDSCAACTTPRSGKVSSSKSISESLPPKSVDKKLNDVGSTTTVSSSFFNSIKTPEGSWECSTCLVRNKKDDTKCVACSTVKPGCSVVPAKDKPTFSFGIPPTSSTSEIKPTFNALVNSQSSSTQPQFTFGMPVENKVAVSSTDISKSGVENKKEIVTSADSTTSVSSSVISSSPAPLVNSIKKPEGSWECGTCLVQNKKDTTSCVACSTLKPGAAPPAEKPKPTFSFGIPSSSTPTTNSTPFASNSSSNNEITNNSISSKPQFLFGSASSDKKAPTTQFGFPSRETKPENESNPFGFLNSDQHKEKETPKPAMTNLFSFGNTNKETKSEEMNDESDDKPAKKKVSFGNPLTFEKQITNDNSTVSFGNLGAIKSNEISSSSNFSFSPPKFTTLENNTNAVKKEIAPTSNAIFTFGSTTNAVAKPNDIVAVSEPPKPVVFGGTVSSDKHAPPSSGLTNSNSLFGSAPLGGFKAPESENKPFAFMSNAQASSQQSSGFTFNPPASTGTEFGSQGNQLAAVAGGAPMFGQPPASAPTPLFSQPQEQKPFVFNAPVQPQQQAPLFTFTAAPAQTGILGGSTPSFASFSAPSAPKFDPNIKPSFNFTGGATPSFSAPATGNPLEVGGDTKRKMRKAIRRTTQHR